MTTTKRLLKIGKRGVFVKLTFSPTRFMISTFLTRTENEIERLHKIDVAQTALDNLIELLDQTKGG